MNVKKYKDKTRIMNEWINVKYKDKTRIMNEWMNEYYEEREKSHHIFIGTLHLNPLLSTATLNWIFYLSHGGGGDST